MSELSAALALAIEAAREAGAHLLADLHRPGGPRGEVDHAPADEEAERRIRQRLVGGTGYGYLGEETGSENSAHRFLWLVDPNDGTRAYLQGYRGSAVSIGLLRDGIPVLGVVFAFAWPDDEGDLIAWAEGQPLTRNGRPVQSRLGKAGLAGGTVLVSQHADHASAANMVCCRPARVWAMPSVAYRLALVAAGEAVAGVSLHGPGAWDYAGGHALLRGAGGVLLDQDGTQVTYGPGGASRTRLCFGGDEASCRLLLQRDWRSVRLRVDRGPAPYGLLEPAPGRLARSTHALRRAQGCLLGQFAGDALGALVEFQSAEDIASRYPHGVRALDDGGPHHIIAGQPTDDSELALMLARSLVASGPAPAAQAAAYAHWVRSNPFDRGLATTQALGPASRETTPEAALLAARTSASRETQANGSLMRASPLGIWFAGRPDAAAQAARLDSAITHPHPVPADACAAFAAAIAVALHGADAREAYAAALREAARGEGTVHRTLLAADQGPPAEFWHQMGWVLIALQNAFFELLHAPSLEEGLVRTVGRGGDTDTNGAIAGALLGAVHARTAIPEQWRRAILTCRPLAEAGAQQPRPQEFWPVDALELSEALLALGAAAGGPPSGT